MALTCETFLKYYVLELENAASLLKSDEAVTLNGPVFELYATIRNIQDRYAEKVPG